MANDYGTCVNGHSLSPENTYEFPYGVYRCRKCEREKDRARAREKTRLNRELGRTGPTNAEKTHCKRGHPFDEANTYRNPRGGRICRQCKRAGDRPRIWAERRK